MKSILERIEQRLSETGQSATTASKNAGRTDAIRNIQRAVRENRPYSASIDTLEAIAEQLDVSLKWIIFGDEADGQAGGANDELLPAVLEAVEGTYLMLGLDQEEASALLKIVLVAAQEPPTPSAGKGYHRLLAELEARKFLKSKHS